MTCITTSYYNIYFYGDMNKISQNIMREFLCKEILALLHTKHASILKGVQVLSVTGLLSIHLYISLFSFALALHFASPLI